MNERKLDILEIITKALNSKKMSVQFLGKVIDKLVSVFPACPEGPLHYRNLQRLKIKTLHSNGNNWNDRVKLDHDSIPELL